MNEKKEYIERGALIDSFENCYWLYNSTDRETVRQALENAPVADVAPVVHGEWISTTKHKWKTEDNGEVDEFAWDREFHNGPVCMICSFTPCVHCRSGWEDDEGCKEHFVCSVCGTHEEKKHPYCHCGAKMDGGSDAS